MPSDTGTSLQEFLAAQLNLSKNRAKALLDDRSVLVNRRRIWMARHILAKGDVVEVVCPAMPTPTGSRITVLLEDRDFLVINKPAGMLANGPDSAESRLREERGENGLRAAHRLDRDTSGCLLVARSDAAFEQAVSVFRNRKIGKTYRVIAAGQVGSAERVITFPLDGQTAITRIRTISSNREATYLNVEIETGRTHQIRRHLAMIGHPVLGDRQHATRNQLPDRHLTIPRQMLHSLELSFRHPYGSRILHAQAPLPDDFAACLSLFNLG